MVDLEVIADRCHKSAIGWAKTGKEYSKMREDFIYLTDTIVDNNHHPRHTRLYQKMKQMIVDSTIRQVTAHLSQTQLRKLRIVLESIATPVQKVSTQENN